MCLGLEHRVANCKAQTKPLSYGGNPNTLIFTQLTDSKIRGNGSKAAIGMICTYIVAFLLVDRLANSFWHVLALLDVSAFPGGDLLALVSVLHFAHLTMGAKLQKGDSI